MKNILVLAFLLIALFVYGQERNELKIQWEKTYGGQKNELVKSIIPSKDGIILIGSKQLEDREEIDLLVIKLSNNGEIIWEKTFGDKATVHGSTGIELENGEIYISGTVNQKGKDSNILVYKLTAKGALIWKKEFGGSNNESVGKIIIDKNKDLLITGTQEKEKADNRLNSTAYILKLDLNGNKIWKKNYVSKGVFKSVPISYLTAIGEGANTIIACKDGGYIIGGYSMTSAKKGLATDGWICKVDSSGNQLWDKSFGAVGGDNVLTITEDEENIVVTGMRYDKPPPFVVSLWFLKFNSTGDLITERYYNQGNKCFGGASTKLSKGRYVIVGSSSNREKDDLINFDEVTHEKREQLLKKGWEIVTFGEKKYLENDNTKTGLKRINEDNYIVLVNDKGEELWNHVSGGNKDDRLTAICRTEKGAIYATGYTYSKGNGLKDILIVKLK